MEIKSLIDDFLLKSEIEVYKNLLKDISTNKETQKKCHLVMLDRGKIEELKTICQIITINFNEELRTEQKGIGFYLVGIFLHCLNSFEFWQKLVLIIGSEKHKSTRAAISHVAGINCIFKKIVDTIEIYFKCLEGIDNKYMVKEEKLPENCDKRELLLKLQFNHIALIIELLLSHPHPTVSTRTSNELFVYNQFDEDFLKYLKDYLRIITLT